MFFKAIAGCPPDSSSSRAEHQHTQRAAHGTGCGPTVQISSHDQWPPNSPNTSPVDCYVSCAMLEACRKLKAKPKTIAELKESLQVIWSNLYHAQGPIDKTVKDFTNKATEGLCWSLELSVDT